VSKHANLALCAALISDMRQFELRKNTCFWPEICINFLICHICQCVKVHTMTIKFANIHMVQNKLSRFYVIQPVP
jgi:hypothetical protein